MLIVSGIGDHDGHDTGAWHPERPERLQAVNLGIRDVVGDDIVLVEPREATIEELERVHTAEYLTALEQLCGSGGGELDPDTPVSPDSWTTSRRAAGAGLAALDALATGEHGPAFVSVRPPGHHARASRGMGFCLLNNVAVAAAALAQRNERVLIVDWDVHHGNGTQEIFWDDPRVSYVSMHQSPLFPGTGRLSETGGPHAPGGTLNFPFPAGTRGEGFLRAIDEVAAAIVDQFAPTWVLVSAGFDAHRDDPLAELELSAGDYGLLARRVAAFAPGLGRLALFLEGGYDLIALRHCVATTIGALLDHDVETEPPTSGGPGLETVRAAQEIRRQLEDGARAS